jgi:hypothetical protein
MHLAIAACALRTRLLNPGKDTTKLSKHYTWGVCIVVNAPYTVMI